MKLIKSVLFGGFVLTTSLIVLGSAITAVAKKDKIISKLKKKYSSKKIEVHQLNNLIL